MNVENQTGKMATHLRYVNACVVMDLRLLHHNVVLTVTDVGDVTFAEIPRLDPEQKWDLKTTEMNSCSKRGILIKYVCKCSGR